MTTSNFPPPGQVPAASGEASRPDARRSSRSTGSVGLRMRVPCAADGPALWELVRACGPLSLNSSYAYVLMADMFSSTCVLAERDGRLLGAVVGLRPPSDPAVLFVWQVGVHPQARGQGLAQAMLDAIFARRENQDLLELRATVGPSNRASERMFRAFAERRGAVIEQIGGYPADHFPESHEAERLFRIRGLTPTMETPC